MAAEPRPRGLALVAFKRTFMIDTRSRGFRLVTPAVVAAGLLLGCGQGPPPVDTSTTEAKVQGKVVINGKTVTSGVVVFDPTNYLRKDAGQRRATIGKDGTYSLTTLLGENSVRYEGPAIGRDRELSDVTLSYVVKEGDNQFDVVLSPQ
jgi:hypothetical protein